jgi:hypothetical protein
MPALVQMMSEEAKPTVWAALAKELGTQWLSDRIQKKKLTEGQVTIEDQEHPQVFLLWGDVPNRRVILYYNPAGGGRVYLLPSGTWQSPRPVSVEGRIRSIKSFGAQRWDIFNEANTPIARVTRGVSAGGEREELRIHRGGTDREEDSVFRRPRPVE